MVSSTSFGLVDTHCHLNLSEFDADRPQVIERARNCGITRILVPGIDIGTCESALKLASEHPEIFVAVGVHPNSGMTWVEHTLTELRNLAGQNKVVAIGEIGLDYYREFTTPKVQRRIFVEQLELAAELKLPVIVHNRNAIEDIVAILKEWCNGIQKNASKLLRFPGVMHSFSANTAVANTILELNFKIGVTGPVTFKNAADLRAVVALMPLECLLIETDAPFLTPHPYRGQRNEPANVRIVAEKIAEIKQISFEQVVEVTTRSANQLFDWRVVH